MDLDTMIVMVFAELTLCRRSVVKARTRACVV